MSEAYDRVVAAIPLLSAEERARIAQRLRALESLAGGSAGDDDLAGVLCDVISATVLRMSGERVAPVALRRSRVYPALRAKAADLEPFLARAAPDRVNRRALLALGVELLHIDLVRAGFSVTARTLMSCAHQLPAVLDRAFPGYARCGRLGMIVGEGRREEIVDGH